MFSLFIFSLLLVVAPIALPLWLDPTLKPKSGVLLPVGIVLHLGAIGILAQLSYPYLAPSGAKLAILVVISALAIFALFRNYGSVVTYKKASITPRALLFFAGLALIAIGDGIFIGANQGWSSVFHAGETYFRQPFPTEVQRHLILTEALLRHAKPLLESPFFIGSPVVQPLFWNHLAALFLAPFQTGQDFGALIGFQLAIGYIFYFLLLWSLVIWRPQTLARNRALGLAAFFCLIVTHVDLAHFVNSLMPQAQPGIESDGSAPAGFFHFASVKFLTLGSPSETLFFIFLVTFLALEKMGLASLRERLVVRCVLTSLAMLASPLLAVLFFPWYFLAEILKTARRKKSPAWFDSTVYAGLSLGVAGAAFWVISDLPPWAPIQHLLSRNIYVPLLSPIDPTQWIRLPLLWVSMLGMVGVALSGLVLWRIHQARFGVLQQPIVGVLLLIGVVGHYVVSGNELRQAITMISSVVGLFLLARLFPTRQEIKNRGINFGLQGLLVVSLALHSFFLFCHTGKVSQVDPAIAWNDYLQINTKISKQFPNLPVVGASLAGLVFPPVMQATSSFASPLEALRNGSVSSNQFAILIRINSPDDITSYARRLGYRAIVWGPIEERVWGARVRERFVNRNKRLAESGGVTLFELTDAIADKIATRLKPDTAPYYEAMAQTLNQQGWAQEAIDNYYAAIQLNPKNATNHNNLGLILVRYRNYSESAKHFSQVIGLDPRNKDAYNNLGAVLTMSGKFTEAVEVLNRGLTISSDPELYVNLAQAFLGQDRVTDAVQSFKRALKFRTSDVVKTQALVGLGDGYARLGEFDDAKGAYSKILARHPDNSSIHVKLGNALAYQGRLAEAQNHYERALKLDPRNEAALRAMASLAPPKAG